MQSYFISLLTIVLFSTSISLAQKRELHGREEAHGELKHHRLSVIWGHAYVPKAFSNPDKPQTLIIPTIGLDYEYFFSHKFAIGLSNELELSNYVVETRHHTEEVEREYAYVGAILAMYEVSHLLIIGIGPGIEIEKNHNFFVGKITVEREFPIMGEGGWDVTPVLSYELKSSHGHGIYDAFTFGIGIGKRF
ncbi:hypothetical protein KMW28_14635 [Flammeovirga yaeyamensis]|uniref:Secreted protein n=1 Tax=Flammeovirga yaeyamensis TaxID=367791 RepID=A0AAX1N4W8_9BACT|nr:hypothetical protein [Flammeovirga yaeyamensis]MBB3700171.1 hypothetical protein [Flammeovirga yaeyamensis]NMF37199.1 hypothetical protein [Flammeovirga yaeyamensis]QWG00888.1 hypothetical protein KMW28_14635 [Flammeovirga yaeyamensis]